MLSGNMHTFRDSDRHTVRNGDRRGSRAACRLEQRDPKQEIKIRLVILGAVALIARLAGLFKTDTSPRLPNVGRTDAQVPVAR